MRKLLITFLVSFCCLSELLAEDIILRVILNDGTQNDYIISERPQISFSDNKVTFTYRNASTEYLKADLQNFLFIDSSTGISQLRMGDTRVSYKEKNNSIIVEGTDNNDQIQVFSISGIQYYANVIKTGDRIELALTDLPKGYYIIKIGNKQSIKISKK